MLQRRYCGIIFCMALLLNNIGADYTNDKRGRYIDEIKDHLKAYISPSSVHFFSDILAQKVFTNYEFKVAIPPKSTQCYFQSAEKKTKMDFEFQCVSAPSFRSEPMVSAWISNIGTGQILKNIDDKRKGKLEVDMEESGTLGFCIENKATRDTRLVQLSFDMLRAAEIPKFHMKNQAGNDSLYHIYDGLFQVSRDVGLMRSAMMHTRSIVKYDYSMTTSNLTMVNNFSIMSLVLIMAVSGIQLHMVKKMFGVSKMGV